jgi:hypothetical protein
MGRNIGKMNPKTRAALSLSQPKTGNRDNTLVGNPPVNGTTRRAKVMIRYTALFALPLAALALLHSAGAAARAEGVSRPALLAQAEPHRRAEEVAYILTESFDVPPENLVTQGYGEQFLKIDTQAPERANRRVAARRITPLLARN